MNSICPLTKKIIGKWNPIPGYFTKNGFIRYDISYYCNQNKVIHNNKKELNNCKFCKK